MRLVSSTIKFSAVTLSCCFFMASSLPGQTADSRSQGSVLYKQGKYAEAARVFEAVCQSPSADPNTLYYYALSLHQSGSFEKARRAYQRCAQQYPSSPAGRLASQALSAFQTPGRVSSGSSMGGGTGIGGGYRGGGYGAAGGGNENLPESAKIYFKPDSANQMIVDAYVNNRPIKMLFDTGADGCAFGKNHLRELGMPMPTGKAAYKSQGVGDGGTQDTWEVPATVRVGIIERKIMIGVQENLPGEPLLGQNFFNAFTYTIDKGSSSIQFNRKQRAIAGSSRGGGGALDRNSVPFEKFGNSIMVTAMVNGRSCKMIFDTGATGTVFAPGDIKALGIEIPPDAEPEVHQGIAGDTRGVGFEIQRMTLGPIDRPNFHISVINGMATGNPLIGRSFLGEWQYTIDNDARIIHFLRR